MRTACSQVSRRAACLFCRPPPLLNPQERSRATGSALPHTRTARTWGVRESEGLPGQPLLWTSSDDAPPDWRRSGCPESHTSAHAVMHPPPRSSPPLTHRPTLAWLKSSCVMRPVRCGSKASNMRRADRRNTRSAMYSARSDWPSLLEGKRRVEMCGSPHSATGPARMTQWIGDLSASAAAAHKSAGRRPQRGHAQLAWQQQQQQQQQQQHSSDARLTHQGQTLQAGCSWRALLGRGPPLRAAPPAPAG